MDAALPITVGLDSRPMTDTGAVAALQKTAYANDRTLTDYVAQLQAQGAFGQQLGNPAALGSEALKFLNSYFDRVSSLDKGSSKKVGAMSESKGLEGAEVASVDNSGLPPGPAGQMLETASPGDATGDYRVSGIGGHDVESAIAMLSELLSFAVETQAITAMTSNVTKSTTTLLRGS